MAYSVRNLIFSCLGISLFLGCTPSNRASTQEELEVGPSGFYAIDAQQDANKQNDPLRKQIGSLFLVEQFNAKVFDSMKKAIKEHPPGGIVYWNPDGTNAQGLYDINFEYAKTASDAGQLPILFSTDYEGGGLGITGTGKVIPGIQRFTKGFTRLAHAEWLGRSMNKYGTKLCRLHGEIMAKELSAVGVNYPLATTSDLGFGLFTNRGISRDSDKISKCMIEMLNAFQEEKGMTFVTKHFPGLGETSGDTHEGTVISKAKSMDDLKNSLAPYIASIEYVNKMGIENSYSILASHAKFEVIDRTNITTVSKPILHDLLREKLNFKGVVLSDAMWRGDYGHYSISELMVVYLKSVLAGMDLLMISGKTFAPAVKYFRDVYDNTLPEEQKKRIASDLNMEWSQVRELFIERLQASVDRVNSLKRNTTFFSDNRSKNNSVNPQELTRSQAEQYYKILKELGMSI